MSKVALVKELISKKDWKSALREAKDFRIDIKKEQHSTIVGAYECIVHPAFYLFIGKNLDEV